MKYKTILISFIFLNSCSSPVEQPDNLIPEDEFINIMTDFYLYNAAKQQEFTKDFKKTKKEINTFILNKYQIDTKQFVASHEYYMLIQDKRESIYKKVKANLKSYTPNKIYPEDTITIEDPKKTKGDPLINGYR